MINLIAGVSEIHWRDFVLGTLVGMIPGIFTIVLLSYIGVFDARPFDEYYVLAEKLKEYVSVMESRELKASREILKQIETELIEGMSRLATPTSIKIV